MSGEAETFGISAGGLAVGASVSDVNLGRGDGVDEVVASLDDEVEVQARTLRISAFSRDDLLADSVASAGGAIAVMGAESDVASDQATLARIGKNVEVDVTSLLVSSTHDQDVDAKADYGLTALIMTERNGYIEIAELLENAGAGEQTPQVPAE